MKQPSSLASVVKTGLPLLGVAIGIYFLINVSAPMVTLPLVDQPDKTQRLVETTAPNPRENHLYIPKINIEVPIVTGDSIDILEKGAWHRKPENGDPVRGGNFVLSAHRFTMGWTPQETRKKSPFFYIDRLDSGDKIYVDYEGKRYLYEVSRRYKVDRTAVEIEATSATPKMTLYSCDLRGEKAGREVIEAVLKT